MKQNDRKNKEKGDSKPSCRPNKRAMPDLLYHGIIVPKVGGWIVENKHACTLECMQNMDTAATARARAQSHALQSCSSMIDPSCYSVQSKHTVPGSMMCIALVNMENKISQPKN